MTDWRGRRVLVTGHTGFKGAWLAWWLHELGAEVHGLALPPEHADGAYALLRVGEVVDEHLVDIRDAQAVDAAVGAVRPDVVLHLAAQALVRRGYARPGETWATNVQGTANLLAASAAVADVQAVLVVTSDKVYEPGDGAPHTEGDRLGGKDPYSASKAAAELVVRSWPATEGGPTIATARAGNVVGGGDRGEDRLVPDVLAAHESGTAVVLRYPAAVRPWQFVLEPLSGYLAYAAALLEQPGAVPRALNFGPVGDEVVPVEKVVSLLADQLGDLTWTVDGGSHLAETGVLRLDASRAAETLGWRGRSTVEQALRWTVEWHDARRRGDDVRAVASRQIQEFDAL